MARQRFCCLTTPHVIKPGLIRKKDYLKGGLKFILNETVYQDQ